jgi:hypothetical protein
MLGREGGEGCRWDIEFCAEIVLDCVEYGDEAADYALGVALLGLTGMAIFVVAIDEDNACEIADAGANGGQAVATGPEAAIAGAVAEDEHQTNHNGKRGDDGGWDVDGAPYVRIEVDNEDGEEGV